HRLALHARAESSGRQTHEKHPTVGQSATPLVEITLREAQGALDEELTRLAEKYRAPLVLCYLEGATRDEAAQQLGWSLATLKRRLEQGRKLLRARLTRRGLTLSAGLLATLAAEATARPPVPPSLAQVTLQAAMKLAAGAVPAATGVSARVT